ncbi:MAG: Omp28-related outer membrane protein, partial [Calditrichia bacterium]
APDSARLIINGLDFGLTPQKIFGIPTGKYRVELLRSNYAALQKDINIKSNEVVNLNEALTLSKVVLLEHFANTRCLPCPLADSLIAELAEEYGPVRLITLGYHTNFPGPDDPMYLSSPAGNEQRRRYYKPNIIPTVVVDGIKVPDYRYKELYENLINQQLQVQPSAVIRFFTPTREDSAVYGMAQVKALSDLSGDIRVYCVLIENHIEFSAYNGQDHFDDIFRAFYPDENGLPLNLAAGEKTVIPYNFQLKGDWGRDLTVICFLQNNTTKSIIQAATTRYPDL